MDYDQSINEARSSEPITESPTQGYVLPNHQDGIKLESNISNQGVLGSESSSNLPAQEHILPRSQEGMEYFAAMAVHSVINDGREQTSVSLPQSSEHRPVDVVSEECSYNPQSDSSGEESRELDGSSEYSWRESNMTQTWDSSARNLSSVDDQRRTGTEFIYLSNYYGAGPPVLNELVDAPQTDRWRSRPNYQWSGYLPDIYESRRLESQCVDGRQPILVQGPTQHFGPPLKPFDGPRSEDIAIEQWRRVSMEREIREAQGL